MEKGQTQAVNKVKGGSAISKWLNSLLGRKSQEGQIQTESPQNAASGLSTPPLPVVNNNTKDTLPVTSAEEDAVEKDLFMFKKILKNVKQKIAIKSTPVIAEGKVKVGVAATKAGKVIDTTFLRKLIRLLLLSFFIFIIGVLIFRFFNIVRENNNGKDYSVESPSISITYQPIKQSIYATDPAVLRLEESVNTLRREVVSSQIRVTGLTPPVLDFNITF